LKRMDAIITIDGPAASGKTSVSRELAKRQGWSWVSTGAFYRGLAFAALNLDVSLDDEVALAALCQSDDWEVRMSTEQTLVFFKGRDVTGEIFSEETANAASRISQYPSVRVNLLRAQRACSVGRDWLIAEGRDCGTVVFPDAKVKIYLTAGQEHRAQRRAQEKGQDLEAMKKSQAIRDRQDSSRAAAPMAAAPEAYIVDTSSMPLDEVVNHLQSLIRKELELP
jgi:CMP/dCMP kinase